MRSSAFGRLAALVGLGAMLAAGAALAQTLILRVPVAGGGAAVSGPQNGPPATLDLSGVSTLTMAGGLWSGSFTIVPGDAELVVGGVAGSLTTDTGVSGSLDDGDAWTADTGGLVLSRSGGTITLSGTAEAGQYSLELTPQYAATATPLTLTALDQTKLTASDGVDNDQFGFSVALDGDTALIGARLDDDAAVTSSGSAYVFTRSGGVWTQQQKLTASDAAWWDQFGYSVALDGDTALIGARGDDAPANSSGSAYVFTRTNGTWTQQAKLTASDAAEDDGFGVSVAVDGDTALIGALFGDGTVSNSGSAYVFTRTNGTWAEQTKLTAGDAAADDWFGRAVALDGNTALIGAQNDDDGGNDSGSGYVFTRTGGTWSQQQRLTASDAAAGDQFGIAVALDGDTALIGAQGTDNVADQSGSAYVFTRSGGVWTQQARLTASDPAIWVSFGQAVALAGDTALIGAYGDDDGGSKRGSAYVFTWDGSSWTQKAKLTAFDAATRDRFGISVVLDGDTALIGVGSYDNDNGDGNESAYITDLTALP